METLSALGYPITPQSQISHLRSSHFSSPNPASAAAQATRIMQEADSQEPPLSASQESLVSLQSAEENVGSRLQTSSSDVSQLTADTDFTSSTAPERPYERYVASQPELARVRTPEAAIGLTVQTDTAYAAASPMSLTSPVTTNGTKRTASGHVKNAPSLPNTPLDTTFGARRARTDSISSTSSRAGDLALTLKARLGYAMAKVQHGWEHKNINEVENLARHKASPNRHSMSHLDYTRRPMSSSEWNHAMNGRYAVYETNGTSSGTAFQPSSKRHSGSYASFASSSQPILSSAPRLQPAPDIRPQASSQRHYHTAPSSQTYNTNTNNNVMSPPRTPVNGELRQQRPPTIRTELQTAEAERDALQALFQLGSPHGSQIPPRHHTASRGSSSQAASPLRSEFPTPRRVTFARSESEGSSLSGDGSLNVVGRGGEDGMEV